MTQIDRQEPPRAARREHLREVHGTATDDPWSWLRNRDDPEVIAHLEAENLYTRAVVESWGDVPGRLFEEIRSRIQETDMSVPVRKGPWWYQARTVEGQQYPIHVRRPDVDGTPGNDEHVLLDENTLAGESPYLAVGDLAVSPDHELMAYTVDLDGDEYYELRVVDLATGELMGPTVQGLSYGLAWANDNATLYYLLTDETHRPDRVMRHRITDDPSADELVFTEPDQQFWVGVGTTRSEKYVVLTSEASTTSEAYLIDADDPMGRPEVVMPRRRGHEYRVDHQPLPDGTDRLLIMTNDDALDFRLVHAPVGEVDPATWTELIGPADGVRLVDAEPFANHLVVTRRENNVPRLTVVDLRSGDEHDIEFGEEVFEVGGGANVEFDTTSYRYGYSSLVTPNSVYDYDLDRRESTLLKQQPVLGGFESSDYRTAREWAIADDGTSIPISLVWRHDTPLDGTSPCLLYGYGAYEIIMPATFSSARLSLLDRGFVYAIAHVRGGGELGRKWYDGARYENKINTFTDFVACARHLGAQQLVSPERIVARGGSAGGLLIGAVLNIAPELFAGAVAEVPFVDNVNTMLDADLPLTVNEYDEWGNPADREIFDAMVAYSPYENVADLPYPPIYATAGLNDPRVQFWEPAKWVARLREEAPRASQVLLKTEMGAGHGGPSGRYDAWRDEAETLAFVLACVGLD